LGDLLLKELAADYASFHEDVPLAAKLIHSREQQVELLRIDAAGLDASGHRLAAWDAYMRLADFTADEPAYLRIANQYTVRSDRWISGRLAALWASASADERQAIEKKLAERRPALDKPRTAGELRHYLAHLGNLPGADPVRLALANYLVEHGRPQEAEIELLQLQTSSDQNSKTAAARLLSKLQSKTDRKANRLPTEWPSGHVDAEVRSTSGLPMNANRGVNPANPGPSASYRPLRIEQDYGSDASSMQWFISLDCSEIVGRNASGDDVFHFSADQNSLARQYRDSNLVHGARLGHLLYVTLGGQIMALDSRQDHPSTEGDLLWPPRSQDDFDREPARPHRGPAANLVRTNRPPLYHFYGRKRMNGAAGIALGSLGPVTPRGVVFQDDNEIKCVDPITGTTLWARTDIPLGCELFGDGELVFAADVGGTDTYVMRLIDGQLVGKRDRPKAEWLLTAGGNVAQLASGTSHGSRYVLSVRDIWAAKTVYQVELPNTTRFSVVEPNAVAAFVPTGRFLLVDVESGRLVVDTKLDAVHGTQAIHTIRAGDNLFVFITSPIQSQVRPLGQPFDYPIINGPVYAFDMKTGKQLWSGPAIVRNRGIYLSQPPAIPLLVFADRKLGHSATAGSSSQLRVLCLDKRTGETIYRNDEVPDSSMPHFAIRAENDTRPVVSLELGTTKIQLTMTDRPRPPQPPGNDDLEASREVVERGLRGLGLKLGNALPRALSDGTSKPPEQSQRQGNQPNSGSSSAKDATNTPDDD
ncbi:MAG TPA: hypothetical protein VFW73_07535, partial [Lacipirellulaceae bacterium]|nr:hypothetical protein [Lacipirellulaceae bacterium]